LSGNRRFALAGKGRAACQPDEGSLRSIAADRARAQQQAAKLPKGPVKTALLKKIDQLDKALDRFGFLSGASATDVTRV
jgi:hypothetical protein